MVTEKKRDPLPDGLTPTDHLIVEAITPSGVSSAEILSSTKLYPEDLARRLPRLRAAGYVDSIKEGRKTVHHLIRTP